MKIFVDIDVKEVYVASTLNIPVYFSLGSLMNAVERGELKQ
jgi:hypothetical protein